MNLLVVAEQALNGLVISTFYALTALGLSIIFGVLRIVNFAHGELYMLGGYVYYLAVAAGKPAKVAIVACRRKLLVILNAIIRDGRQRHSA
ncbi:ABC transporter permease subunit [Shumkonia mesophila]|uniref:ABC transporter permease subunit n=1 Tax=Shumkonia mesophila TaxID=2838854 RepID=UPI002934C68C|nr:hypothetical protein [Shumkonia mesophila]